MKPRKDSKWTQIVNCNKCPCPDCTAKRTAKLTPERKVYFEALYRKAA